MTSRADHTYLSRLTLLPRGSKVEPGQTVVPVTVERLGPRRRYPGTYDDQHPLDSLVEIIASVAGDEHTVLPGEYWSTEYGDAAGRRDPNYGSYGRFALVAPEEL